MVGRRFWWCGLCAGVLACGSGDSGGPSADAAAGTGGSSGRTGSAGSGGSGGASDRDDGGSGGIAGGMVTHDGDTDDGVPMIGTCRVFPADNAWNLDVSALPVHEDSDTFIDSIGRDDHVHPDFGTEWEGAPIGIPVTTVVATQADVPVVFTAYGDESDPGPYPIPLGANVEGGPDADGDRHVIAVDLSDCTLYEMYRAFPQAGEWHADSGAVFDLATNDEHPYTYTSADAAGLPIFPGLVRYDEVVLRQQLPHAVRFTVSRSRRALIAPARHHAGASDDALATAYLRL